jgi:hypothetical protein
MRVNAYSYQELYELCKSRQSFFIIIIGDSVDDKDYCKVEHKEITHVGSLVLSFGPNIKCCNVINQ